MATFRTRARTLDMLGRQQIAGIPTAISELFKNAHDAYADRVEIDYYRSDGLFVLRDDGFGMSREEFAQRWLTIGTESKLNAGGLKPIRHDPGKHVRPMLGEKGIGRLAISTIGPQVLALTRARHDGSLSDLTAAFVNWTLFECPGIDLEDIQIPIRTFPGGDLPSYKEIQQLISAFSENTQHLRARIGDQFYDRISRELGMFRVDPQDIDRYLGDPSLSGTGSGTQFIIVPTSDLLPADIDGEPQDQKATPLTKALLGFANTMTPGHSAPVIKTAFRDHKTEDLVDDLIAEGEFFTPDEFENADHQIEGHFDEYGQFRGDVLIYGEIFKQHVIPWTSAGGSPTLCGPFSVNFAAIEGVATHSTLPREDHARMAQKMEKIGGLYIFRDGVRILPYGNTDYDWLDIEFHRTKSAYYYYFSHRKMFGAIQIDSTNNPRLNEKAGREGFRENKAYRQFKSILKHFIVQVAADFFRKEGVHSERFEERKEELSKIELDRRRRERSVSIKKQKMSKDLAWFFEKVSANSPQEEAVKLSQKFAQELKVACLISDPQHAAQEIVRVEQEAHAELRKIESQYKISRPRIGLSKAMQKEWNDYTAAFSDLADDVFIPTRELIEETVRAEAERARVQIDRSLQVKTTLEELAAHAKRQTRDSGNIVKQEAHRVASGVRDVASTCLSEVEDELRSVVSEFQRIDVSKLQDAEFVETRNALEARILGVAEDKSSLLGSLIDQLKAVELSGETSALDQLVAIEQRNVALEEEVEADLQLAQLGMAVEIINHEFHATIRSIRNNLRRLKAWADINKDLEVLYHNIRASFDHLDGYLTLFTPLQRRLYRRAVEIRGSDIYTFLSDLFKERFTRLDIEFLQTRAFSDMKINGYPSSFYPVFVNVIDNAVYWVSQNNPSEERRIVLDATDGVFLVSDSGPGVNAGDREAIFEFGFTRKPGGRGMGLHIAREVLRRVGYDLSVTDTEIDKGTTFAIGPASPKAEK